MRPELKKIFGTRTEAVKLRPLAHHLASDPDAFQVPVYLTVQHRGLLDQVLGLLADRPDSDRNAMSPCQAAMEGASRDLQREDVPADSFLVTGNLGIHAVLCIREELRRGRACGLQLPRLDAARIFVEAALRGLALRADSDHTVQVMERLPDSQEAYRRMTRAQNQYGVGHACERIAEAIPAHAEFGEDFR
jgi:UDP-N-acetylglucosamine 2-epimerase